MRGYVHPAGYLIKITMYHPVMEHIAYDIMKRYETVSTGDMTTTMAMVKRMRQRKYINDADGSSMRSYQEQSHRKRQGRRPAADGIIGNDSKTTATTDGRI